MSTGIQGFRPGEQPCEDCGAPTRQRVGALWFCAPHAAAYRRGEVVVVAPPERPQEAPAPVQAAPAMTPLPVRPVAALKLATVSVGQYRERWVGGAPVPRKKLPMVVGKPVRGQCRIDGCVRNARTRGLCEGCARQATEEGVFEQVAAAAIRSDSGKLIAAVVQAVRREPGRTIRQIGPLNGLSFERTREAAYIAVKEGKLMRRGALYYLPGAS